MSKKHHYVPRSLLKNFSVNRSGQQVCVFDKKRESSYITCVNDAGSENHFNTVTIEGRRINFEGEFQRCDDELARIVRKLMRSRDLAILAETDRVNLAHIAAIQLLRGKLLRMTFVELTRQLRQLLESTGASVSEEILPSIDDNDARRIALRQLADAEKFVPYFLAKNWRLHAAPEGSPFWISDNPVARVNLFPYGDAGLSSPGVQICFPLGSDLLLSFDCGTIANKLESQSTELAKLMRSKPTMRCTPENVLYFNSLQVFQSVRYIYGPTKDFDDARQMVRSHPNAHEQRSAIEMPSIGQVPKKPRMPDGRWLVAYGARTHHMVPVDEWENRDGNILVKIKADTRSAARAMLGDGPFSLIEIYLDQHAGRGMRDVVMREVPPGSGTVEIQHSDPALHELARKLDARVAESTGSGGIPFDVDGHPRV